MWRDCTKLCLDDLMVDAERVPQCQKHFKSDAESEQDSDIDEFFECNFMNAKSSSDDSGDEKSTEKSHSLSHNLANQRNANEEEASTDSDALSDCADNDSIKFARTSSSSESDVDIPWPFLVFGNAPKRRVHNYKDYEDIYSEKDPVLHPEAFKRILTLTKGNLKELDCLAWIKSSVGMSVVLPLVTQLCPNLEVLKIANVDANEKVVKSLGQKCPKLRILTLRSISCLTDDVLAFILCRLKNLEYLKVSFNNKLRGTFLNYLKKETVALDVGFCDKFIATYLVKAIKEQGLQLKKLTLSGLKRLSTSDFKVICHNLADSLENLHIRGYDCNPLVNIGDVRRLKNLKRLYLMNCSAFISDSDIKKIPNYCKNLEVVDLSGAADRHNDDNVTEEGLEPFAVLPNLRKFDISGITCYGDSLLKKIANNAPKLKHLDCYGCPMITNKGVIYLLRKKDQLEYLNVGDCESIRSLELLKKVSPIINGRTSGVPLRLEADINVCKQDRDQCIAFDTPMLHLKPRVGVMEESDSEDE